MPRPVLVDLPPECFLQPVFFDDVNLPKPRTGSKRSRSPSLARSIFSPAKRRILEQEGLFSPAQSHPSSSTIPHSIRSSHGAFLHAFDHPKRPVGTSPAGRGDILPLPPGDPDALVFPPSHVSRRVSPRLSSTPTSKSLPAPTTPIRTSPRKTRSQTSSPSSTTPKAPSQRAGHTSTPSSPMSATKLAVVLREMPPRPDRRSVHYPGFDVHQDTHVALPCTRSRARAKAEAARLQSQEGDSVKENVRPVLVPMAMAKSATLTKGKVKGDVAPRRSARLRTNNNGCVPSQEAFAVVAPEARGYGHRWRTLHELAGQF